MRPIMLGAHFQNQRFEGCSTVSAQEKQILKATETLQSRQLSS